MSGGGGGAEGAGRGPHCGLSSLLPVSCRGRAAAFARDLHSRLRTLGAAHHERPRDAHDFYHYECESPSSPLEDTDLRKRSPADEQDPPFYDVDSDSDMEAENPFRAEKPKNGFRFSSPYNDSPVKKQPIPRENGHSLFSPIAFEDCVRKISCDLVDSPSKLSLPLCNDFVGGLPDSDSDFESAKSDPSDGISDEIVINDLDEVSSTLSLLENVKEKTLISQTENVTTDLKNNDIKYNIPDVCRKEYNESEEEEEEVIRTTRDVDTDASTDSADVQEDHEDERPQRVRRCSSLKSGKTPPGTPGRKKIVRFADVLGLDLADVKTFMDEIPVIPKSAYDDLTECDLQNSPPARLQIRLGALTLVPLFQLPRDVSDKLEKQNVCLETARVCEGVHVTVCGSVRVRNLDFHKTVHIRYTMNRWKSFTDLQAVYVQGSCDGYSDRFQFILYAPCINSGERLELAVRFQCKGQQFWDNNSGLNYCFDCLALGAIMPNFANPEPLHPTMDWHPSFY